MPPFVFAYQPGAGTGVGPLVFCFAGGSFWDATGSVLARACCYGTTFCVGLFTGASVWFELTLCV